MARQIIQIQSLSDIKVSKNKREYFTLEDMAQTRYVCFNPKLHPFCQLSGEIDADVEPGKSEGDTPRLNMVYKDDKPVIEAQAKEVRHPQWGGRSDKELLQQRQLAEAQNKSIQAQTALNRAVDLAVAGQLAPERCEETAKHFYLFLQTLTLISEAEIIQTKVKEVKTETQTSEEVKGNKAGAIEPPAKSTTSPSQPETYDVSGTKEDLFNYIKGKMKLKSDVGVLSFLKNRAKIDISRLDTEPEKVKQEVDELQGWV